MSELKDFWKQTAKSFVLAFNDLGISLVESAKAGVDKAVEWARTDNPHYEQTQGREVPDTEAPAEEPTTGSQPQESEETAE